MPKIENEDQLEFSLKHGKNVTDRMVPDLLQAISVVLNHNLLSYNGKTCEMKQLGNIIERDGEWSLLFDVKNPDEIFDHVEFKIVKTGWGRSL